MVSPQAVDQINKNIRSFRLFNPGRRIRRGDVSESDGVLDRSDDMRFP
jgi:hypothetical protein